MVPWPYLGLGCNQEQVPASMNRALNPFGMPCREGGAVAVENVGLFAGFRRELKHCMVFYTPELDVPKAYAMRQPARRSRVIVERGGKVLRVVSECISSGEAQQAPVDLARMASCIMYRSLLSDENYFPCQGVAVMPVRARSPLQAEESWSQAKYSAFKAPKGSLYTQNVPVEVHAEGYLCGVLNLSILVHSPVI